MFTRTRRSRADVVTFMLCRFSNARLYSLFAMLVLLSYVFCFCFQGSTLLWNVSMLLLMTCNGSLHKKMVNLVSLLFMWRSLGLYLITIKF